MVEKHCASFKEKKHLWEELLSQPARESSHDS